MRNPACWSLTSTEYFCVSQSLTVRKSCALVMPSRTSIRRVVRVSEVVLTKVGGGSSGAAGLAETGVGAVIGAPPVCALEHAPNVTAIRTNTTGALNRRTQAANA